MNDDDIAKLATKLTQSLATKDDIKMLQGDIKMLQGDIKMLQGDIKRLETKIDEVDHKADVILKYADGIEETVVDLDKRVNKIEAIPLIAHNINK